MKESKVPGVEGFDPTMILSQRLNNLARGPQIIIIKGNNDKNNKMQFSLKMSRKYYHFTENLYKFIKKVYCKGRYFGNAKILGMLNSKVLHHVKCSCKPKLKE